MFREDGSLQSYWIIEASAVGTSESRRSSRDLLCLDALVLVTLDCRRPLRDSCELDTILDTHFVLLFSHRLLPQGGFFAPLLFYY